MAEVGRNAYATTGTNTSAGAPNVVAVVNDGTGDRQIMIAGDAVTAANLQTIKAASTAAVAADMGAVVHLHPTSPLPAGTNAIGNVGVTGTVATTAAANTTATGSITANGQVISISVPPGGGSVGIQITGTWVGQIDFQATVDNVNYVPINTSNGVNSINATAGNGIFVLPAAGYLKVQAKSTIWTSGTATVSMNSTVGSGPVLLSSPLPQGTNAIGTVQIGNTQNTTNVLVAPGADANAKSTTSYFNAAQLATVTAMKASAGKVYALNVYNPNSTIAYLQMFDLATGSVTLGTTVPKKSFPIPATGYLDLAYTIPIGFATAISHAATTTSTGLTAPSIGLVINGEYI